MILRFNFTLVIILFLSFVFEPLYAFRITAKVMDSSDRPLPDAVVTDGYKRTFTDSKGNFTIETNADSLLISRQGYEQQIIETRDFPSAIILTEKPSIMPAVRVIQRLEPSYSTALDKTVITPDAETSGNTTADLLLRQSAFHTAKTRLAGENQTLSLLGNLSRHTLIVLDNVSLNPHGEAFDLASLPVQSIRRIEIVKGNASVYGGAAAIGGVVYLYSDNVKDAETIRLENETAIGAFGRFSNSLLYEQQASQLSYRILFSRLSADNDFPYQPRPYWNMTGDLTRKNNRKEQQNFSLGISSTLRQIFWQYSLDYDIYYRQLPGSVNFLQLYEKAFLTGHRHRNNLALAHRYADLNSNLTLWQHIDNTKYNNTRAPNPVYPTRYSQDQNSQGIKSHHDYRIGQFGLGLGLELSRQTYERKDMLYPHLSIAQTRRLQKAVSCIGSMETDLFPFTNNLQTAVRLDDVTDFGTYTSWRVEDMLTLDGVVQWQLGLAIGNGFALPSFYDLYWKGDAQSLGNPELEPETSLGGSIKLQANYLNNFLSAAYYSSEVRKLIQWRQTYIYGPVWKPFNIGKADINNLEFNLKTAPFKWILLQSSLTLTTAKDKQLDANLTYTPESRWTSDLTFLYKGFSIGLNSDYTGRQWTTPDNLIDPLPPIWLANAFYLYSFELTGIKTEMSLRLNNLFDKQYEVYAYVPQPGFNWTAGLLLKVGL